MVDVVKRLRYARHNQTSDQRMLEAADEIERLREVLKAASDTDLRAHIEIRRLRDVLERIAKYPRVRGDELGYEGCRQVARDALKRPNGRIEGDERR